jgi:hypothetical protein
MNSLNKKALLALVILTIVVMSVFVYGNIILKQVPQYPFSQFQPSPNPILTPTPNVPKPSAPEFTLKYFNGYVEATIVNPSFTPFEDANNNLNYLFYNFSVKENDASNWTNYYQTYNVVQDEGHFYYISPSNSETTVLDFHLNGNQYNLGIAASAGSKLDFEVQAHYGYWSTVAVNPYRPYVDHSVTSTLVLNITQTSDWSNTQTVTIPAT